MNNLVKGSWMPIRQIQLQKHKKIMLHFVLSDSKQPICGHAKKGYPLSPNKTIIYCKRCQKLYSDFNNNILRECKVCGLKAYTENDLLNFRKDKTMLFGYANFCLSCFDKWSQKFSISNRERERERARQKRRENPDYWKHWIQKHGAEHVMAQRKTKLDEKCKLCGSKESLLRHHPDYSQPMFVITLCKSCHGRVHSNKIFLNNIDED